MSIFEKIKKINEYNQEYWSARELCNVLEYAEYTKFKPVINKAINACKTSQQSASDHFAQVNEMIEIGKGGTMPEDLPTPDKSIKQLEKEHKKFSKKD